jgi:hypothetical protein
MSWLGDMLSNKLSNTSTTGATGDSGGVYRIVGPTPTTVPNGGYAPGVSTTTYPYITTGTNTYISGVGQSTVHISGIHPRITTDKSIIDLDELSEFIKVMKERLLIITPNFEKHEKYAALKKAYDHYKLIESMIGDESDNK